MAQMPDIPCPNCGSAVHGGQRFCTNCGTPIEGATPPPPPPPHTYAPLPQNYPQAQQQQAPPYAQRSVQQQVPPYAQQPQQRQSLIGQVLGALGLLWMFWRAEHRYGYTTGRRRQSSGCCASIGCLILLAILIVPGIIFFKVKGPSNLNTLFNSGSGNTGLTTQPPITTTQINSKVTYASVDITILNAQQSQAFLDDDATSTNGMVRLDLQEHNAASKNSGIGYSYTEIAHLILPNGNTIVADNAQYAEGPDVGISRTNWLDFPVATSVKINRLILRLGKDTEAQIDVPLTGKANLAQYESKTVNPNVTAHYDGLNWTIRSSISALSSNGQQASKGMRYITLTLKIDNPSSNDFNAYWGDYMRLKSGSTTSAPTVDSTIPLNFPAGSSGSTGSAIFLMPDNSGSFTLILLGNTALQITQATVDFQLL